MRGINALANTHPPAGGLTNLMIESWRLMEKQAETEAHIIRMGRRSAEEAKAGQTGHTPLRPGVHERTFTRSYKENIVDPARR